MMLFSFTLGMGVGPFILEKLTKGRVYRALIPLSLIAMSFFIFDIALVLSLIQKQSSLMGVLTTLNGAVNIHDFFQLKMSTRIILDLFFLSLFGGVFTVPQFAELHAEADIVVNLLPLTPATRGLFNAATVARMLRGASLVNLARGAHVVDADLLAALARGHIARAVLDVFHTEPLPREHAYWSHPRVTVLPHIAAPTDPRSAVAIAAANVHALRAGRPLAGLVDRSRGY